MRLLRPLVVGFTTSLAKHNHGEVSQAFEHLSHHRKCVEKWRHRVRRLKENEENSQEFMGGFDNLLQNSILPSLKKHSTGLKEMFLFKKLTECNLGALEGRVQSLMGIEHHHDSLRQRVDQVQQGNNPNSALAQQMSDSMGTLKQQMELLSQSHANSPSPGDLLRRLKLHGMKRQKVPKIQGLKKHQRTILWLAKNQAVFETPKELLCKEFWPFLGPNGSKKCFFWGNGLFLARGLAQRAVHCPSKVR